MIGKTILKPSKKQKNLYRSRDDSNMLKDSEKEKSSTYEHKKYMDMDGN